MSGAFPASAEAVPAVTACEREPIHIPGSIEPNGALLALQEPDLKIVQASANTQEVLGHSPESLLGQRLDAVLNEQDFTALRDNILKQDLQGRRRHVPGTRLRGSDRQYDALVHRSKGILVMEFEPADAEPGASFVAMLTDAVVDLEGARTLTDLCQRVTVQVRALTGFDRVMLYRFLEDDSGSVIAEDTRAGLAPYLGLRYPASDIPPQARRLYLLNTLRLKADVNAERASLVPEINPVTRQPLDMSHCILRSMSPVHVEYLRNMGVTASMSVSIIKDDRLWGLIACHHLSPKVVPHSVRISCEVLARLFSATITAAETREHGQRRESIRVTLDRIGASLRNGTPIAKLVSTEGHTMASAIDATGAALCIGDQLYLIGTTPPSEQVRTLIDWLANFQDQHLFATDKLSEHCGTAGDFHDLSCGLLSARIALAGTDFLLWFRPPSVQVVHWAGNPAKPVEETEKGKKISPRRSFELWKETVGDRSEPWVADEKDFAASLRHAVAEALLVQKYQETTRLNVELERSNIELDAFAYSASHDLQEPIRTVRSYTQLLSRRVGSQLDEQSRELIKVIENGAVRMGTLVSALLAYGQVGGSVKREPQPVNLEDILRLVIMNIDGSVRNSGAVITHDNLPVVQADPDLLMQLLQNLLTNSIKYRKQDCAPQIHFTAAREGEMWLFRVRDNGEGIDPQHLETIFGAFKRLHGREIPGTGIGLALCKRIVEHHGGKIWVESAGLGHGSTFSFTLPVA